MKNTLSNIRHAIKLARNLKPRLEINQRSALLALRKLGLIPQSKFLGPSPVTRAAAAIALGTFGYQLVVRYGRILVRLQEHEERLDRIFGHKDGALGILRARLSLRTLTCLSFVVGE